MAFPVPPSPLRQHALLGKRKEIKEKLFDKEKADKWATFGSCGGTKALQQRKRRLMVSLRPEI
ncbi:hypothetical protein HPP92_028362 [Vanilla planifolia]|uniref:Uncharacterized protein n=1 Tax=Vanilla planifolia TaxID=51239 RepID=A0A835P8G4_VANPL|nr:hypothetical protein HPP92_028362 [Vanilla planifolia]KAG0447451.1 hypothetical protein HPP92_028334 [Vanilla planifolia]